MAFRAVIFDLFGTLVDPYDLDAYFAKMAEMADILGLDIEDFKREWLDTYESRARGDIRDMEENLQIIGRRLGARPFSHDQVLKVTETRLEFSRESLKPRADAEETLRELEERGYKLGLISDCTWEVPELWDDFPLEHLIDQPVFSCRARLKKPDSRIFRLAMDRLRVGGADCLYVGDGGSNELEGARSVGMTSVLIRALDDTGDAHGRIDPETWNGHFVSSLSSLLDMKELVRLRD